MAIIYTYPYDNNIQDDDAWIGTDSLNGVTKQFTADKVANYLNVNGKVSVAGQMSFIFNGVPLERGGIFSLPDGFGNGTPFSDINILSISKYALPRKDTVKYIEYLVGAEILIAEKNKHDAFGHYKIVSYVQNEDNEDFYNLTLSYIGGNGLLYLGKVYDLVNFTLSGDKKYVYTQPTPSIEWNIEHNLDKFPSVSVVNNNNLLMYGEITYVDENNLTINFSGGFSGKAYLN